MWLFRCNLPQLRKAIQKDGPARAMMTLRQGMVGRFVEQQKETDAKSRALEARVNSLEDLLSRTNETYWEETDRLRREIKRLNRKVKKPTESVTNS